MNNSPFTQFNSADLQTEIPVNIAILSTEWNEKITEELVAGALRVLNRCNCQVVYSGKVPGAFELPYATARLWSALEGKETEPDAIIVFGAVIQGGTPHFQYVCQGVTEGIMKLNCEMPIPVIFGVLTLNTEKEAWERLGGKAGHKGEEAAITALKMAVFSRSFDK